MCFIYLLFIYFQRRPTMVESPANPLIKVEKFCYFSSPTAIGHCQSKRVYLAMSMVVCDSPLC